MNEIKDFFEDEAGFTGAEKALITLVGLGLILLVVKVVTGGAKTGATTAAGVLSGQKPGTAPSFEP